MIDDYKKDLDRIHAPDSLIAKTLQTIEQNKDAPAPVSPTAKKRKFRWYIPTAAAAAVLCLVLLLPAGNRYNWAELSGSAMYREAAQELPALTDQTDRQIELSAREYSEYIDLDCTSLIDGFDFTEGSGLLIKDEEGDTSDLGTFYYKTDDMQIMVQLSESDDLVPDTMQDIETSSISGQDVLLARSQGDGETARCAAGEKDGISYYLYSESADERTFIKAVKNFLKN